MRLIAVHEVAADTIEMHLENSYIAGAAVPGQFLHLLIEGHTLRRPISIAEADSERGVTTILFKKTGDGTRRLAGYRPGMILDVLGPAGNGFSYNDTGLEKALLIGGGLGVPPLYHLGKVLRANGVEVTTVLGFQSKEHVFYEEKFSQLGMTYIVTNDGSYGHQGFVTNVLSHVGHFDHYFSCGPVPMLQALTHQLMHYPGSISLEERMGCGVGACLACVIPDKAGGYHKICKDGPVFSVDEVLI